ncbi:ion transporter [Gammaproteobacteria bacterium]|nr:ion transporter [Gammaproteobacteria bacterium]
MALESTAQPTLRDKALRLLEKGQHGDKASHYCDYFLSGLIVVNVLCICIESVPELAVRHSAILSAIEVFSMAIFSTEYCARIWVAASKVEDGASEFARRLRYILSPNGLVDLIAILPNLLEYAGFGLDLRWVRILRLLRLLKISHYTPAFTTLFDVLREERYPLSATLYLLLVAMFFSSASLYLLEGELQEGFRSIPDAMWWSIITLTTVGYGDVSPISALGKVVGALTAIMGVMTVAMMTGIVASSFANKMSLRKETLQNQIIESLEDGIISGNELEEINRLAGALELSDEEVDTLIRYEKLRLGKKRSN